MSLYSPTVFFLQEDFGQCHWDNQQQAGGFFSFWAKSQKHHESQLLCSDSHILRLALLPSLPVVSSGPVLTDSIRKHWCTSGGEEPSTAQQTSYLSPWQPLKIGLLQDSNWDKGFLPLIPGNGLAARHCSLQASSSFCAISVAGVVVLSPLSLTNDG